MFVFIVAPTASAIYGETDQTQGISYHTFVHLWIAFTAKNTMYAIAY